MPLWGNKDYPNSNSKPLYANTSNAYSNSTINGNQANTDTYYGYWIDGNSPCNKQLTNIAKSTF